MIRRHACTCALALALSAGTSAAWAGPDVDATGAAAQASLRQGAATPSDAALALTQASSLAAGQSAARVDAAQPAAAIDQDPARAQSGGVLSRWLKNNGVVRDVADASRQASTVVVNALGFLGVRYRYGGHSASTGFDCSGFVSHVYQQTVGLVLPHNARAQSHDGEHVDVSQLQPGDLVFFNTLRRAFSHVGIYIGNGQFVHAPRRGQRVQIGDLSNPYWASRFDGARRLIGQVANPLPSADAAQVPDATAPSTAPAATATLPQTN